MNINRPVSNLVSYFLMSLLVTSPLTLVIFGLLSREYSLLESIGWLAWVALVSSILTVSALGAYILRLIFAGFEKKIFKAAFVFYCIFVCTWSLAFIIIETLEEQPNFGELIQHIILFVFLTGAVFAFLSIIYRLINK
jgi:hypothetical protein